MTQALSPVVTGEPRMKSKMVMLLPRKGAGVCLKLLADIIYLLSGRKIERKNQKKQREEKQRNVVYGVNIKMLVWPLEVGCILILYFAGGRTEKL